jgi:hypothetical protein
MQGLERLQGSGRLQDSVTSPALPRGRVSLLPRIGTSEKSEVCADVTDRDARPEHESKSIARSLPLRGRETSYSNHAWRLMLVSVASERFAIGTLMPRPVTVATCVSDLPCVLVWFASPSANIPPSSPRNPSWPAESSHVARMMTPKLSDRMPLCAESLTR